jgi:hypothetical protein
MQALTEDQKMEEGKRMFSIFAARMFEQRVLQAYREKIAQERQMQLLRELEAEDRASKDREARKAKENQKKKDKRRSVLFSFISSPFADRHRGEQAAKTGKRGGTCSTGG